MPDEIKHPERLQVGAAHVETYMPDLLQQMRAFGDHQFLEGLDAGLAVTEKLCNWLTSAKPPSREKLREYVLAEHQAVVDRYRHKLGGLRIPEALRKLNKTDHE